MVAQVLAQQFKEALRSFSKELHACLRADSLWPIPGLVSCIQGVIMHAALQVLYDGRQAIQASGVLANVKIS